jgi:hypothetical protein
VQFMRELPEGTDGTDIRVIRRLAQMPGGMPTMEKFQAQLTISADELLAEVLRGEGDKGAQLREAGYTSLADALGL